MNREHGRTKYVVEKCRCEVCKAAAREYERERKNRAEPAYVGADRARQHVRWLSENGVGLKQIVKVSGVAQGTLWKLMYGDKERFGRPSKRVRHETERAILAVRIEHAAGGSREPAGPTLAAVDRLVSRGWTRAAISRAIGQNGIALQLGDEFVTRANARAVAALLDQPVPSRLSRWGEHQPRLSTPAELAKYRRFDDAPDEPRDIARADVALPSLTLPDGLDVSWRSQATCRRADFPTWLFFPGRGDHLTVRKARDVCARCPVHDPCLDFAVTIDAEGIWAGTTEKQRRELRRQRSYAEAVA